MTTHVTCKECKIHTISPYDDCATWHSDTTGHEVEAHVFSPEDVTDRMYRKTVPVALPRWMRGVG